MQNNLLLDLNVVKSMTGTFFVELTKGYYTAETDCWADSSIYVYGDIWTSCLDGLAQDFITDYDFFEFTDISEQDNQNFCQALLELSDKLDKISKPSDLESDEFLSSKKERYIRFDNSMHDIIDQTPNQSEIVFNKNFAINIIMIANTYRDLAGWLTENRSYGVSILGI